MRDRQFSGLSRFLTIPVVSRLAGPEWEVISSRDFGERIMATPVLDGSRIYVRTDAAMYCFEGE